MGEGGQKVLPRVRAWDLEKKEKDFRQYICICAINSRASG